MVANAVTLRLRSRECGHFLGEIPLPAEHGVTQVLSADSCSPFGGGWTSLLWPRTTPAVPKLQTLTSSCASQCVLQSSPPSRITASASLTAFSFRALALACSLPPYEGVPWVFFWSLQEEIIYKLIHCGSCVARHIQQTGRGVLVGFETKLGLQAELSLFLQQKALPSTKKVISLWLLLLSRLSNDLQFYYAHQ